MKMISLFKVTFLVLILTLKSLLAQSVRDATHDNTDIEVNSVVTLTNDNVSSSIQLYTEGKNSSTKADATRLYLPVESSNNNEYSIYRESSNGDYQPEISGATTTNNARLTFTLDLDVQGAFDNLYLGTLKADGSYDLVLLSNNAGGGDSQTFSIDVDDICSQSDVLDCSKFNATLASNISPLSTTIVFFLFDDATISSIAEASITNGSFYQVFLGHDIDENNVSIDSLTNSDKRVFINYTGFNLANVENIYAEVLINSCASAPSETLGNAAIGKSSFRALETINNSGTATIKNLKNDECYGIRIVICDKFGFCSKLSNTVVGEPQEIEVLLKEQGCFFFTAGFAGSHWIIDYFQKFRDNVLRKNSLGQKFIKFYYIVGPKYAPYVLDKPYLQKAIRGLAYVLYGFIFYFNQIVMTLIVLATLISLIFLFNKYYIGVKGHGRS